ncbi:CLUMA_CG020133, isoform A [Clunio marinus]|uniref:CLUMA_CG020133, isoform A n=1 Tax=Clunio marinus TaxID=568069 RepID=A0A1J1J5A4_9DIPT|nr:CLUMA_CG020133, isoform A [Clunio marinus]
MYKKLVLQVVSSKFVTMQSTSVDLITTWTIKMKLYRIFPRNISLYLYFGIGVTFEAILARTPVQVCSVILPMPDAVFFGSITNPCLAEPCQLSRGNDSGIPNVEFIPRTTSITIMTRVRATVFGKIIFNQELPAEIINNPCSILTQRSCPLPAGIQKAYRLQIPVDPTTSLVTTDTGITHLDHNNQVIFCYRIDTALVS